MDKQQKLGERTWLARRVLLGLGSLAQSFLSSSGCCQGHFPRTHEPG